MILYKVKYLFLRYKMQDMKQADSTYCDPFKNLTLNTAEPNTAACLLTNGCLQQIKKTFTVLMFNLNSSGF